MSQSQTSPEAKASEVDLALRRVAELSGEKKRIEYELGVIPSEAKKAQAGADLKRELWAIERQISDARIFLKTLGSAPRPKPAREGATSILVKACRVLRDSRRWETTAHADRARRELLVEIELFLERGGVS